MKNYKSLTFGSAKLSLSLILSLFISFFLFSFSGCDKDAKVNPLCNTITLSKPFTAKIGETWCLANDAWQITFGPYLEDSRCNVENIECVWAGRFVMAATIDNGEITRDTFFAVHAWRDTLYSGPYSIILNTVYPEQRLTMEPVDTSSYAFEMIVK